MYEKIKHSICVILQLIKSQQKDSKLNSDDEDFMIVLSETFTKLCVRLLIQNNFIEMKECVATSSACMTRKPRCAYQVFLNKHDLQHDSLLSHSSYVHMYIWPRYIIERCVCTSVGQRRGHLGFNTKPNPYTACNLAVCTAARGTNFYIWLRVSSDPSLLSHRYIFRNKHIYIYTKCNAA